MDSSPSSSQSRPSNKNACPICGRDKTAWSLKCGTCEANRQRYLAAIQRVSEDRTFLEDVAQRGQSTIARERGVKRQAISQQVAKARRRLDFITTNPLPPLPAHLIQQTSVNSPETIPV
jgi:hypothetical protein